MRQALPITRVVVSLSCLGLLLPPSVAAAAEQPPAAMADKTDRIVDVALDSEGAFRGRVVDRQGRAISAARVVLLQEDRQIVSTKTNTNGDFAVAGIRGGVYLVAAANGMAICRVWVPGTAPPPAKQGVLIASDDGAVRGQYTRLDALADWITEHPILSYTFLAAVIAVPIAVIDHNRDKAPES